MLLLSKQLHGIEDINEGSSGPIDPPHHDGVTGFDVLEEPLHPRTRDFRPTARGDVGDKVALLHARVDEGVNLKFGVLALVLTRVYPRCHPGHCASQITRSSLAKTPDAETYFQDGSRPG